MYELPGSKNASIPFWLHRISVAAVIEMDVLAATGGAHRLVRETMDVSLSESNNVPARVGMDVGSRISAACHCGLRTKLLEDHLRKLHTSRDSNLFLL